MARLSHPNVVTVHDVGDARGSALPRHGVRGGPDARPVAPRAAALGARDPGRDGGGGPGAGGGPRRRPDPPGRQAPQRAGVGPARAGHRLRAVGAHRHADRTGHRRRHARLHGARAVRGRRRHPGHRRVRVLGDAVRAAVRTAPLRGGEPARPARAGAGRPGAAAAPGKRVPRHVQRLVLAGLALDPAARPAGMGDDRRRAAGRSRAPAPAAGGGRCWRPAAVGGGLLGGRLPQGGSRSAAARRAPRVMDDLWNDAAPAAAGPRPPGGDSAAAWQTLVRALRRIRQGLAGHVRRHLPGGVHRPPHLGRAVRPAHELPRRPPGQLRGAAAGRCPRPAPPSCRRWRRRRCRRSPSVAITERLFDPAAARRSRQPRAGGEHQRRRWPRWTPPARWATSPRARRLATEAAGGGQDARLPAAGGAGHQQAGGRRAARDQAVAARSPGTPASQAADRADGPAGAGASSWPRPGATTPAAPTRPPSWCVAHRDAGRLAEAERWAEQASAIVQRIGDPPLYRSALDYARGWIHYDRQAMGGGRARRSRARCACASSCWVPGRPRCWPARPPPAPHDGTRQAHRLLPRGDRAGADASPAPATPTWRPSRPTWPTCWSTTPRTRDEACRWLAEAVEVESYAVEPNHVGLLRAKLSLAQCRRDEGKPDEARRIYLDAIASATHPTGPRGDLLVDYGVFLMMQDDSGRGDQAAAPGPGRSRAGVWPHRTQAIETRQRIADSLSRIKRIDAAIEAAWTRPSPSVKRPTPRRWPIPSCTRSRGTS